MAKPLDRPLSRYTRDALLLLGQLIRERRIAHHFTVEALAERAGVSRGLMHRIEKGDPGCSIGAVFEAAAVVGVPLFNADQTTLAARRAMADTVSALLPKAVHATRKAVKDAF